MRYYSTQRPVTPGSFPNGLVKEIHNYDSRTYIEEIGREAWGYIEYDRELSEEELQHWELTPAGTLTWFPVTVSSKKHGGGLRINSGRFIRQAERPADTTGETAKMQWKTRYYPSWEEAVRVINILQSIDITTERVRMSVTQGEVKVFINGEYILNFGDDIEIIVDKNRHTEEEFRHIMWNMSGKPIVLPDDEYYGENIGGWASRSPDSTFVLGPIWHPHDYVYHYSEKICRALGITQEEWIEGNYWNREGRIWKATEQ